MYADMIAFVFAPLWGLTIKGAVKVSSASLTLDQVNAPLPHLPEHLHHSQTIKDQLS